MKIAVVSAINRGNAYYRNADETRRLYCARHGYPYTAGRIVPPECDCRTAAWTNFLAFRQLLMEKADVVVWMDPDTIPSDMETGIEESIAPFLFAAVAGGKRGTDILIAADMTSVNIGFAAVANSERIRKWMDCINRPDFFEDRDFNFYEQTPFMRFIAEEGLQSIFPRFGIFVRDSSGCE